MGAYASQVGTRNVARDLEAIRLALGDPKLDYLGYSYGTVVGATYAQMFPATVGRLVLDGPPDYWISARDYAYRQGKGFMEALSGFLDWCQQTGCSLAATGNPRDQLNQLIARVDQQPMPAAYVSDGVTRNGELTGTLLENAVLSLLYDRSQLALARRRAERGGELRQCADAALVRRPVGRPGARRALGPAHGGQLGDRVR